ncbi:nitroreductase family protein [Nocardioides allogilvus]|uniref:nitroreductase family protein n=1 Tax=Nocardioides allogilvus TaxID=2072017 RepID=UPI000D32721E|nr:nitroreductase family protein [Nocardioides allogilvus]
MEFQEVVRRRRMVRRYADRPVAPESVDRLLANATRGPSAGFTQGWAFLVLDTPADVDLFWTATSPEAPPTVEEGRSPVSKPTTWLDGMRTAPVVIVPMSDKGAYLDRYAEADKRTPDWPVPYWHMDVAMASLLILQTAVDEGLGACFFGVPGARIDAFRAAFDVPPNLKPVGAITVGHRADDTGSPGSPARRPRRSGVVHRGRFSS